jgi:diguanylate cyclase (GGDEF)-like protein/PAS domain S-box-containing protein
MPCTSWPGNPPEIKQYQECFLFIQYSALILRFPILHKLLMPPKTALSAFRIALIYLVVAALWILLSDRAVDMLVSDHASYVVMQTWKGWLFVAVTAVLLFLLVHSALQKLKLKMLEQQKLSNELMASRSIQGQLLEALDDGVWMRDTESGQYLFMSPAIERIYGSPAQAFMQDGKRWLNAVHVEDRLLVQGKQALLEQHGWAELEYRITRPDGGVRWVRDRTHRLGKTDGQPARLIGIVSDITLQRQHAEHIHRLSHYDSLTGLPNRMHLQGMMDLALAAAQRDGKRVAVLHMDIARLRDINDSFGHAIGDEILRRFARRLDSCMTKSETVARLTADEFAIVLPDLADGALAGITAQRILDALAPPFILDVGEIRISTSIGISLFPVDAETPDVLLQHAGLALHDAKLRGAGQLSFYQPTMNAAISERVSLLADLHHALGRKELELYYQPQIDLASGRVVAVEALMRWHHPQRGAVSPAQFIPLAEESGLILMIGEWALQEACRQNRAWRLSGLPPITMAVNISAVQFRAAGLRDTVARALDDAGLEPSWLELEVTESAIMDGTERMLVVLAELRSLGVQLSIDDFGTGYSSLSYLTRFNVNKLKIDQAFVRGALKNERDAAIVGIIVQMAKQLHLSVIAEGVETAEQVAMLKEYGCDEAQGYFYARPMPAAALEDFLRQRSAA